MRPDPVVDRIRLSTPCLYRIEVQGEVRPNWADRLGGMRVLPSTLVAGNKVTVLEGRVSDQAELSCILNTLHELHLPLLSVQYLGDELSSSSDSDDTGVL
mgnify:CR=1 FL=1